MKDYKNCGLDKQTLTTIKGHYARVGDIIDIKTNDNRLWRKALYWLLRRGQPQRIVRKRVLRVNQTTITLSQDKEDDEGFFYALGVISSFLIIAIVIIACMFGAIDEARADTKDYIVIGQSNAQGIYKNGDLDLLLSNDQQQANIIDCTHSGKPIRYFLPTWNKNTYYGDCINKIKNQVAGIIFWQGENETYSYEWTSKWPNMVRSVLTALRQDAGNLSISIIVVALNTLPHPADRKYWNAMRHHQLSLTGRNLIKIDSRHYEFMPDNVHLTVNGYKKIAEDIASRLPH